ncbi:metallophosphoesterase [Granulicella mallensis MP5ACTX8]|uniref:Metallophosphoesterase n=1 Tax=Granulicella mallensis (strain ATCC BAA-1857 / DSM 23137 / MP5ACTX8) TaxID=682795 RepID=G8NS64_GRAMM|nr:metallophosphoesterase [Granulicella mallensis MP5ACTX8]
MTRFIHRVPLRFLILSDIHANGEALKAVHADAVTRGFDLTLCLGDVVGYGPDPNEAAAWVSTYADVVVRGNHDRACSNLSDYDSFHPLAQHSAAWTKEQLLPCHVEWLAQLPRGPLQVDNFDLVHGAPDDEDRYLFDAEEAAASLRHAAEQVTFFGHTHVQGGFVSRRPTGSTAALRFQTVPAQLTLEEDSLYLLNPGSVGQPRDGDPRAAYCIYEAHTSVAYFYRVEYDIRTAQEKILAAGLPEELAYRLATGR